MDKSETLSDAIVPTNLTNKSVTADLYDSLEQAFDFLNTKLFADTPLPDVAIVLQCHAHSAGHFAPDKYNLRADANGGRKHELNLNPDGFTGRSDRSVIQTLLHEMVHLWQHHHGKKKRAKYSYHDLEWADKMESLGLMPSNTGMVGGKRTGTQMSDFIIPDGAYDKAFDELEATGWRLNLESAIVRGQVKKPLSSKIKFSCSNCNQNAWGKPELAIRCDLCDVRMTAPPDAMPLSEAAE